MQKLHRRAYPYGQVIIGFAGVGSIVGGIIAQLIILCLFREARFEQIGFQPLLYVGLFGLIPALLTGVIVALKQLWRTDYKDLCSVFYISFVVSAFYIGAMIIYLGIESWLEVGVLLAFMLSIGLFGGVNATIASFIALPKSCKSRFDNNSEKEHDIYKGLKFLNDHE